MMTPEKHLKCPLEAKLAASLAAVGITFQRDCDPGGTPGNLDFHLGNDVSIEVKGAHSPRIAAQLGKVHNAIVLQGSASVDFFCALLDANTKLIDLLKRAQPYVVHADFHPNHAGGCGPESQCDTNCMAAASQAELLSSI